MRKRSGKLPNPSRRRRCIDHVPGRLGVSERRACRVLGQHRSTQRRIPCGRDDEDRLVADMIELAPRYGRYGHRRIAAVGSRTAFIQPGSPWENGYIESFNARLRDELLNGEIFYSLKEAQILIESWRRHYDAVRPHSSLGYRPSAPETIVTPSWPPGGEIVNALTFQRDLSTGAGQPTRISSQWIRMRRLIRVRSRSGFSGAFEGNRAVSCLAQDRWRALPRTAAL